MSKYDRAESSDEEQIIKQTSIPFLNLCILMPLLYSHIKKEKKILFFVFLLQVVKNLLSDLCWGIRDKPKIKVDKNQTALHLDFYLIPDFDQIILLSAV